MSSTPTIPRTVWAKMSTEETGESAYEAVEVDVQQDTEVRRCDNGSVGAAPRRNDVTKRE